MPYIVAWKVISLNPDETPVITVTCKPMVELFYGRLPFRNIYRTLKDPLKHP